MIFGSTLVATFNGKGAGSCRKERSTRLPGAPKVLLRSRVESPVPRESIIPDAAAAEAATSRMDIAPGRHKADQNLRHFDSFEAAGDPWADGFESRSAASDPSWLGPGPAHGASLSAACSRLASRLEAGLAAAKSGPLRCDTILAPERLLERVARLVVRAAEREPCGLAGAVVHVLLLPPLDSAPPQSSSSSSSSRDVPPAPCLARLELDPGRAPTFEVTVLLRRERAWRWSDALLRLPLLLPPGSCLRRLVAERSSAERTVRLSGGFRIVKRKLYRHPEEHCALEDVEEEEEEDALRTPVVG
ncbi:uncharacterized protein LOC133350476 [Lethenteron reissneri]|uniref:uncharacterized protein LOC133350476 n=1 Tax=Lethenteron reissneri TaxID=7753 RepID=UPI002AB72D7D|nr:uncharacterized protein LOC133350476 [Lethenteron reissneri]